MTNTEFMRKAESKVDNLWKKLNAQRKTSFKRPDVYFNLRSRRVAGLCCDGGRTIRLNLAYVTKNASEMLEQTVPHEVAHAWLHTIGCPSHVRSAWTASVYVDQFSVRRRRPKRSPHGYEFMKVLAFLGGETKRTHNMTVDNAALGRRGITWKYKCSNCGYEYQLSTVIHNKIRRGQKRWHPRCGPEKGIIVRVN